MEQTEPFDCDIWIWQGTYDPGSGDWTPTNVTFPKMLAGEDVAGAVAGPGHPAQPRHRGRARARR